MYNIISKCIATKTLTTFINATIKKAESIRNKFGVYWLKFSKVEFVFRVSARARDDDDNNKFYRGIGEEEEEEEVKAKTAEK